MLSQEDRGRPVWTTCPATLDTPQGPVRVPAGLKGTLRWVTGETIFCDFPEVSDLPVWLEARKGQVPEGLWVEGQEV